MAKGINIGVAADTKEFSQGVKNGIIQPLEGVEDAMKDVEKVGDKAASSLEDGFKDQQRETKELKRDYKDLSTTISRESRTAYRDLGDNAEDGFDKAKQGVTTFKEEALQNFGEVASSFDGTIGGIADGVQGTLGGAAVAIGGVVGLAVGTVGAIGGAILQNIAETTEESKQRVSDMYDDMASSRSDFLSEEFIVQGIQDQVRDNYDRIAQVAKLTGATEAEVARAFVTAGDDRNRVLEAANDKFQEQVELVTRLNTDIDKTNDVSSQAIAGYAGIVTELTNLSTEQGTAIDKVNLFKDATATAIDTSIDKVNDLKTATESFHPVDIPVNLGDPGVGNFIYNIQQDINGRRINVPVDLFYRNGVVNP